MAHANVIVETGAIVAGADSWATRAELVEYAESVGITVPDSSTSDVHLRVACEFINQHEANLLGARVQRDQPTAFPRYGLEINGFSYSSSEIPEILKKCQIEFAIDDHQGINLWNTPANPSLIKRRARVEGAVDVEYAVGAAQQQSMTRVSRGRAYLQMLLRSDSRNIGLEK